MLRHQNDVQQFKLMQQIARDLPFPENCFLLGDKMHPNRYPVMAPYTSAQIFESREECEDNVDCSISTLENTGFVLNIRYASLNVTELSQVNGAILDLSYQRL